MISWKYCWRGDPREMLKGANTKQCSLDIVKDNCGLGRDLSRGRNDKLLTWKEDIRKMWYRHISDPLWLSHTFRREIEINRGVSMWAVSAVPASLVYHPKGRYTKEAWEDSGDRWRKQIDQSHEFVKLWKTVGTQIVEEELTKLWLHYSKLTRLLINQIYII